jgi:hypothetical protein
MHRKLGLFTLLGATLVGVGACADDTSDGAGGEGGGASTTTSSTSSSGGAGGTGGGEGGGGHYVDEGVEGHGCIHLDQGPFFPLAASATAQTAPMVDQKHTAYELTLNEAGGGNHDGYIRFEADDDGEFHVFLSEDVDVSFTDAQGTPIVPEGSCQAAPCSSVCALIKNKYKLDLTAGATTLSFGPTSTHDLLVLFEEGGHDH